MTASPTNTVRTSLRPENVVRPRVRDPRRAHSERPDTGPVPASAEEIERISPEGRPAHPELTARRTWSLLAVSVIAAMAFAVISGLIWGVVAGLVVFVLATGLALLTNPVLWSTTFRARERQQIEHEHEVSAKHHG